MHLKWPSSSSFPAAVLLFVLLGLLLLGLLGLLLLARATNEEKTKRVVY